MDRKESILVGALCCPMVFFADTALHNTLLHTLQLQEWVILLTVRILLVSDELEQVQSEVSHSEWNHNLFIPM